MGCVLKTGALSLTAVWSFRASSSVSCACLSSAFEIIAHTRTRLSCPATARYFPLLENSAAHTALLPFALASNSAESSSASAGLPLRSWARNNLSNALVFVCFARTLIYFGGGGYRGIYPTGCAKSSLSKPVVRGSPSSDTSSFSSETCPFFFPPIIRLKKETPFLIECQYVADISSTNRYSSSLLVFSRCLCSASFRSIGGRSIFG